MDKLGWVVSNFQYRKPKTWWLAATAGFVATISVWQYHQFQPITPDQQSTLSVLVKEASRHRGVSHQRIYADLFQHLRVHRTGEIPVSQFEEAIHFLNPMTR